MNNHTYTIYNSLVKRAARAATSFIEKIISDIRNGTDTTTGIDIGTVGNGLTSIGAGTVGKPRAGTTIQAPTYEPKAYPAVNPATGGTRLMNKGYPVGPAESDHIIRKGDLPITPYSSGKINIGSLQQARQQASQVNAFRQSNEDRKKTNAQNLDAIFKKLHDTNQLRREAGLPDYNLTVADIYAPDAFTEEDYADAENRLNRDIHLSTIAHEAARRGTPMNAAELGLLPGMLPYQYSGYQIQPDHFMGAKLPDTLTPDDMGRIANGATK